MQQVAMLMNRAQVGKAVKKPGRQRDQKGPKEKSLHNRARDGHSCFEVLASLRCLSKLYDMFTQIGVN